MLQTMGRQASHHSRACVGLRRLDVCIAEQVYGYDHFCPWMGTAVARGNINSFWSFLGSIVSGHISCGACRRFHHAYGKPPLA